MHSYIVSTHVNREKRGALCVSAGGMGSMLGLRLCHINYLNPTTIKAEVCYRRPPLEARVVASLPQYAPRPPGARRGGRIKITGSES